MNAIGRIKQYLYFKGISKYKFYQDIDVANGFLGKGKNIGTDKCEKIIYQYPDLNIEWLITGVGPMLRTLCVAKDNAAVDEKFSTKTDRDLPSRQIPLYDINATADLVSLTIDDSRQSPLGYVQVPDLPHCDGALYIRGDSMYPVLVSGDIILFKFINDFDCGIFWGELYLIAFAIDGGEHVAVKYLRPSSISGHISLVSKNPSFDPVEIPRSSIRSLALVKANIHFNTIK